jgi:NAD(P)-dependent dehydrogenase (short-subunit alcohol dehydrogenase family)
VTDIGVAVVTGGASGIGRALSERFAAGGARVAVFDRFADGAPDHVLALPVDVTDEGALQAAVARVEDELGPIDVYCSNAGIASGPGLGDDDAWARSWAVHGMAHVYAARAVLPGMVVRGHGHFVVTASAAGLLMTISSAPYTATKHAAVAIAEWLAVQHGEDGVAIHCLCPQGVRTPMTAEPTIEKEVGASGALIAPEVVADAVVEAIESGEFLITPHAEARVYESHKVADRDRWLAGMRRLRTRIQSEVG